MENERLEAMLAQRDFVRGLARKLLADEHAAEGLAQSALASALEARGFEPAESAARSYLAGVLRHLAAKGHRGDTRRRAREERSSRHERVASAEEIVAREEWRQRVVAFLLEKVRVAEAA